jgi:hypothetical protein
MRGILVIIIAFLMIPSAFASQEGMLPFSEFKIQSNGIGESGIVVVEGVKDTSGKYMKLTVKAFRKTIEVSNDVLRQIPSEYQNGIQLSYGGGYKELGGRIIYIVFQKGFTSGKIESFTIAVTEDGNSQILKK